jgi:hypothetical protein
MFPPQQGVCVSSISRSKGFRAIRIAGLFAILFFVSATLHATPIADNDVSSLQGANHRSALVALSKGKAILRSAVSKVQPLAAVATQQPSSGCLFDSNCAYSMHISEPQALALFGTGLLSVASVIRRRLTR